MMFALAFAGLLPIALLGARTAFPDRVVGRISTFLENRSLWFFMGLTLVLRLLLLPAHPVPIPSGSDDFGYLLLGDTFAHGRWSNPPIPSFTFFETVFVLQQPTYSSIFPPAQGLILAAGQCLFGVPWVGVLVSMSLLVSLCHWMLSGWLGRRWAGLGAVLAIFSFGPLCAWTNCYWGGAPAAMAGCVVFGSLVRLRQSQRQVFALIAGLGLGWHLLARPYETVLLGLSVLLFWLMFLRTVTPGSNWRRGALFVLGLAPGIALLLLHSHAVTGDWTKLPYMVSREQYGVPTTFTFQPSPIPDRALSQEQKNDYDAQLSIHGDGHENIGRFTSRVLYRLRFFRFFASAPLYLAFVSAFAHWRNRNVTWAAATGALFLVGTNIYPYFYPHYIAALTSIFLLVVLIGLRATKEIATGKTWLGPRAGTYAAAWLVGLCAVQFAFWYSVQLSGVPSLILGLGRYETWDYLNFGDPQDRMAIESWLRNAPGKQLVFVQYSSRHRFVEWIENPADIANARVIRARDLGPSENLVLLRHFPERAVWLLLPDRAPPQLAPYPNLLDDMMVLPTAGHASPVPPVKSRKSDKFSDWLENVR